MSNIFGLGGSSFIDPSKVTQTSSMLGTSVTPNNFNYGFSNLGNTDGAGDFLSRYFGGETGQALGRLGAGVMGAYGVISGLQDMRKNNKLYKEQMQNMQMQREIARENLAMQRAEYARLKGQRAGVTAAYGG